jgi:hypothetical protein
MRTRKIVLAVGLATAVNAAHAGDVRDVGLSLPQIRALNAQLTAPITSPGIAFGSPVAFGANFGQVFGGIGGEVLPKAAATSVDGSAFLGFGLGDAERYVGLEAAATIISIKDDTGEDGDWNFKVHRVLPDRTGIAVGVEATQGWGLAETRDESYYGVVTHVLDLAPDMPKAPVTLAINVGVGNERFVDPGEDGVNVFGSVALMATRQMSTILDWTGRDLNAAISVVPIRRWPIVLTVGATNMTERFRTSEFAGGIGFTHSF